MPGPSNLSAPAGPRGLGVPNAPKGPKSAVSRPGSVQGGANVSANQQQARRERKWGSTSGGASSSSSRRERHAGEDRERDGESAKRTLTDFRIEGLALPELEWEWRAERVEQEMRRAAEELDRQVREKEAKERQEQEASAAGESVKEEEAAGDMSVDAVNVEDVPAQPSDPTATASVAAGKHRRDEDDDSAQPNGAASEGSGAVDGVDEHASRPKKVRTGDVKLEDGEPVSLDSLHPPEEAPAKEENADDEDGQPIKEEAHEDEGDEEDVDGAPIDSAQTNGDEHDDRSSGKGDTRSSPPPAPAPPRENSRLRIYFSSPTSSTSSYTQPSQSVPPRASSVSASVKSASVPPQPQHDREEGASAEGGQAEPVPTPSVPADLTSEQLAKPVDGAEVMEKIEEEAEKEHAEQTTGDETQAGAVADGKAVVQEQQPAVVKKTEEANEASQKADEDATEDDGEALVVTQAEPEAEQAQPQPELDSPAKDAHSAALGPEPTRAPSVAPSVAASATEPHLMPPEPAADRISISYARNTRRVLLDADVIDEVKIKRGDGRVELTLRCKPAVLGEGERQVEDEFRVLKGVLVS